jgi:hypothetical protein
LPPLLPAEAGWGSVQIPADSHLPDNTVYFAWEVPAVLHAVVVDAGASGKLLQLACAPDPDAGRTQARILGPDGLTAAILSTTDLVVWNGGALPAETARLLTPWLREGGIFVQLPPAGASPAQNAPPSPGLSAGDFSPPAWGALERGQTPFDEKNEKNDRGQTPFGITLWEENDGPLARTENGQSLSLASVEIHTRQIPQPSDLWQVLATHGDGKPFLIRQSLGRGSAYALSSGVGEDWSSLGEGTVLVPFVQRLLHKASQQRHPVSMGTAGEWKPDPDEVWIPVHPLSETEPAAGLNAAGLRDPRWRAGVYQNGSRFVALNRPESEDDPGLVPAANVGALLPGVPVQTLENASALSADSLQSELWPAFSTLLAFFLFAEMALCWSDAGSALRTPFSRNVSRKGVAP